MKKWWLKIRFWVFWTCILIYAVMAGAAISDREHRMTCQELKIVVKDSTRFSFVHRKEMSDMLLQKGGSTLGSPIGLINTQEIEKMVERHPFVRNAEAFKTSDGLLMVEITQRQPVLRIILQDKREFYLDETGMLVPLTKTEPAYTLVCNGHLPDPGRITRATRMDSVQQADWYRQLYALACFIGRDKFWHSQIEQLYVRSNQDLEMIPRVGAHMILLGSTAEYEKKFHKLYLLYTEGLNRIGWNQYEWINLKYENQVICTKR